MNAKVLLTAIAALLLALVVSLFFNYKQYRDARDKPEVTIHTSVGHQEVVADNPEPSSDHVVGSVNVTAGVIHKKPEAQGVTLPKDTTGTSEPPDAVDSVQVTLPITQKVYEDSLYTAYVSGYKPSLDSIRLRYPVITTTITKTVDRKRSRLHVGLIGGYGYGFKCKQLEPFIGLGLSIDLF